MTNHHCRIEQIELYQSRIKLKEPFKISLGVHEYAENIYLIIRTNDGITGYGECSPSKAIHGESMETCFIIGQNIADILLNRDPLNIGECVSAMDTLIYGNTSIKSAFDIALHDIASRHAVLPLYAYLGGKNDKTLITDYTVSIDIPEKMANDAVRIKDEGFQVIKVKLGESEEKDIERMIAIRQAVGSDIPLRIDANQGWDTQSAISILSSLEEWNIQFCEEPIPRWNCTELPFVKQHSPIPIMADESCFDHNDAKRLIKLNACDFFNVKLGKSSGIFKARKIINLAVQSGINMQIGGFLESRLGFTASAHLALTNEQIIFYDFDTPLMFQKDPVIGGVTYAENGIIKVSDVPGLGATLDEKYLKTLDKVVVG